MSGKLLSIDGEIPKTIVDKNQQRQCCGIPESEHPCLSFLGSAKDLPFTALSCDIHGVTLVAAKTLVPGSLLFRLPEEYLITYDTVLCTSLSKIIGEVATSIDGFQISPEGLTWLNMVNWMKGDKSKDSKTCYLDALSETPPNCSSWPQYLQHELIGTNVYAVLDMSGTSDDIVGNVSAVQNLLDLLERIRATLRQRGETSYKEPSAALAYCTLVDEPSIFTITSISWARGHFLSRRFPDPRTKKSRQDDDEKAGCTSTASSTHLEHHLPGYGGKTCTFIPVLDLMNHNPNKERTCTLERTTGGIEVRTGESALQAGDELFYCYGETLSNEILLQGYGFCLPDNPADTVSLKITCDRNGSTSSAFTIGRGGAAAIPSEMWRTIAGVPGDSDECIEIGSGDLDRLVDYMKRKLEELNRKRKPMNTDNKASSSSELTRERLSYISMYRNGQSEILCELIHDLTMMQCQVLEDDS